MKLIFCLGLVWLKKDGFYSGADPKTTAWQLLDVDRCKHKSLVDICIYSGADPILFTKACDEADDSLLDLDRCKNKSLIGICFYSVLDPKLTDLLINSLLDLDRCKHKSLVEICFYSDTDPKLVVDQKRLTFCQICSKSSK